MALSNIKNDRSAKFSDVAYEIEEDVLKSEKEDDEWVNELMKLEMLLLNILKK